MIKINKLLKFGIMIQMLLSLVVILNANDNKVHIMPLGDSITYGSDSTQSDPSLDHGYRSYLWKKLNDGGFSVDFVGSENIGGGVVPLFDTNNEGWGGNHVADIRDGVLAGNPSGHTPHKGVYGLLVDQDINGTAANIVLLHIGTNNTNEVNKSTKIEVEGVLNEIDRYESDYSHPVNVLLAKIINDDSGVKQSIIDFNNDVELMVQARVGDKVTLVDMENNASINYATDMIDVDHPNEVGKEKMASLWYTVLSNYLKSNHYWKFDENSSSVSFIDYNDTLGNIHGTCIGADCPVLAGEAKVGSAQYFDGSDEVNVADDTSFDWAAADSFTIEYWIKPTNVAGTQVVIGRHEGNMAWWSGIDGGAINFFLRDNRSPKLGVKLTSAAISSGTWYHVACVRDGVNAQVKLYVNGIEVANSAYATTADYTASVPVAIGHFGGSDWYDGVLDDVAIYTRELTAMQIERQYQNGMNGDGYNSIDSDNDGVFDENDNCPTASNPNQNISACSLLINTIPITGTSIGNSYIYDVNSSDDPNANFTLTENPTGMTIDVNSGIISWTPVTAGDFNVTVVANNGGLPAEQKFTITVRDLSIYPVDMIHYWKLDETLGTPPYIDSYVYADGTCIGADCPVLAGEAKVGSAQYFDGSDEVNVADDTSFDWAAADSFTIEYWIKPTNVAGTQVVIGRHEGNMAWWSGIDGGAINFFLRDNRSPKLGVKLTSAAISSGTWYHVACVRDGVNAQVKLYVNGIEVANSAYATTADYTASVPVAIGHFGGSDWYDGILDDVAIFNSAVTDANISQHYQKGLVGQGFENDITAPIVSETTAVITPTNNTTPTYVFSSTEGGNITYGGSCTSLTTNAVEGNNTIIFGTLLNGTYNNCTITVTDASLNISNVLAITTFDIDTTPPVITRNGTDVSIELGTAYSDAGASATDNIDGDITANIVTVNPVDINTVGVYTVTYDVNDTAGNAATQVTRTVTVTADVTDTDGDGILDSDDIDDDNDGILDVADADVDGDGLIDNGSDINANGINDANDYAWFTYESVNIDKTVQVSNTVISTEGVEATVIPSVASIALLYKLDNTSNCTAYIEALENGTVKTGYKNCVDGNDNTLKDGIFYTSGTQSIIKKEGSKILIESVVKLNLNESFIIGGK